MRASGMDVVDAFLVASGHASSVRSDAHSWIVGAGIRCVRLEPGVSALSLADELRARFPHTGIWPLAVEAHVEDMSELCDIRDGGIAGADAVAQSLNLDPWAWLPRYISPEQAGILNNRSDAELLSAIAEGPAAGAGLVLGGDWEGATTILLVPCDHSWEAIARAGFGGWNDCPAPPFQAAFHRHLAAIAGLELRGIGRDLVLTDLSNPPRDPYAIVELVRLLTRYCGDLDLVDETEVARILLAGPGSWGFWWD